MKVGRGDTHAWEPQQKDHESLKLLQRAEAQDFFQRSKDHFFDPAKSIGPERYIEAREAIKSSDAAAKARLATINKTLKDDTTFVSSGNPQRYSELLMEARCLMDPMLAHHFKALAQERPTPAAMREIVRRHKLVKQSMESYQVQLRSAQIPDSSAAPKEELPSQVSRFQLLEFDVLESELSMMVTGLPVDIGVSFEMLKAPTREYCPQSFFEDVLEAATHIWRGSSLALRSKYHAPRKPYIDPLDPLSQYELSSLRSENPKIYQELIKTVPLPTFMPVLDRAVRRNPQNLAGMVEVDIQHGVGDLLNSAQYRIASGVEPTDRYVIFPSYSSSSIIDDLCTHMGQYTFSPKPKRGADLIKETENTALTALAIALKKARQKNGTLVISDDGGYAIKLLSGMAQTLDPGGTEYRHMMRDAAACKIRIVEQTANGSWMAQRVMDEGRWPANVALVSIGECWGKSLETVTIAKNGINKIQRLCHRLNLHLRKARVALVGHGVIGRALAHEIEKYASSVVVFDTDPKALQTADPNKVEIAQSLDAATANADLIIGCTGKRVLTLPMQLKTKPFALCISMSSKAIEFEQGDLPKDGWIRGSTPALSRREDVFIKTYAHALVNAPNQLQKTVLVHREVRDLSGRLTAVHEMLLAQGGTPITFFSDHEAADPEEIQFTKALQWEALDQVMNTPFGTLEHLAPERQDRVLADMSVCVPGFRSRLDEMNILHSE